MIPRRTGVEETVSGHQERLRRLEIRTGQGGFQQVAFDDGVLASGASGRLRSSVFAGRVYLDVYATPNGGLVIGTLDASAWPPSTRSIFAATLNGTIVVLTVTQFGVVSVSATDGSSVLSPEGTYIR